LVQGDYDLNVTLVCAVSHAGCTQVQYTYLVDNAGGFDGWVAASLPVNN
jgi:hypothetical protein